MRWRSFGLAILAAAGVAAASLAQERFDYQVRDDMFRAFGGNEAALKNALAMIEEKLSEDPDHAEALVWRALPSIGRPAEPLAPAISPAHERLRPPGSPTWIAQ